MGLSKGAFTFSRFSVVALRPAEELPLVAQLCKHAFLNLPERYADKSLGWSLLDSPLEEEINAEKITFGEYLAFCLRVDRRQVAPALLKIKTLEAEKKLLQEKGIKKIPKALRLEIREGVQERLKRQAQPIPAFFDVCWDYAKKTIWFGSVADKAIEDFENLFKESFRLRLVPYRPDAAPGTETPVFDQTADLAKENYSVRQDRVPAEIALRREFLTWLWFKAEERGGAVRLSADREIEISVGKRFVLTSGDGEYTETIVSQGRHSDHKEARVALGKGKMIREARIEITHDSLSWEFTLKADGFQFQSLRLPAMTENEEESPQGQLLERIYLIEKITDYLDELYRLFLRIRQSPAWSAEELPRVEKVLAV